MGLPSDNFNSHLGTCAKHETFSSLDHYDFGDDEGLVAYCKTVTISLVQCLPVMMNMYRRVRVSSLVRRNSAELCGMGGVE